MDKKQRFLKMIKHIESTGGANTDHKTMEEGIHKGHSAQGPYGLMPNTKAELERRHPSHEFIDDKDYASKYADIVLKRAEGDETLAAGLWNAGHNYLLPTNYEGVRKDPVDFRKESIKNNINYRKYERMLPEALRKEAQEEPLDIQKLLNILGKG